LKTYLYGAGAEYALHSLLILATADAPISVLDLARFQQLPERYLAKVFGRLREAQLVMGTEGIAGGFALARPAADIRVVEVLDAVDPGRKLFACGEIRRNCALFGEAPPKWATAGSCRIDLFMTEAERTLREFLASKTIADLVCELDCKAPPEFAAESSGWFKERRTGRTARRRSTDPQRQAPPLH
jgi:Rrf2 family protein